MSKRSLFTLWKQEFGNYSLQTFRQDLFAGLTVGAVALPLALAFGVASGATAAAGLVTAVASGLVIGFLSGAPYQISGPTGAMSAILIVLAQRYGLQGVLWAGFCSGILLTLLGAFRLGRLISFIPAPVITGFTSGIAIIIAVGQFDNFFGIHSPKFDSAIAKLWWYLDAAAKGAISPQWNSVAIGAIVIAIMLCWPGSWSKKFPSSLFAIAAVSALTVLFALPVATVGTIPTTLFLEDRITLFDFSFSKLHELWMPILSITALGAIESLLCGAVASNMTGVRLQANQELIAQGIGNMLIPFLGGVPATAAIARTSVGIRSGGVTRMVSFVHAIFILASILIFAPIMSNIPLAALSGVLIVTAWRMNEWENVSFYFGRRFKLAILKFAATLLVTVSFDLTQAILVGTLIAAAGFLSQVAQIEIEVKEIDGEKLRAKGIEVGNKSSEVRVAYLTGPLFFAAVGNFNEAFASLDGVRFLILSLRGVPLIDTSGLHAIDDLINRLHAKGGKLLLAGVTSKVKSALQRAGLEEKIGKENVFWSSDEAIVAVSQ